MAQSVPHATLAITATQESVVDNARNLVVAYCIANRLAIVSWQLSMDLKVKVGKASISFRQNGTQQMQAEPADQDYNFTGQAVVAFRTMNPRGGGSSIKVVYSYTGDGTVHLTAADANSTVPLQIRTVDSRITSMDLSSGEGEMEATLTLVRS
jgi:hypothetical protein